MKPTKEQIINNNLTYSRLIGLLEGRFMDIDDDTVCEIEYQLDKLIDEIIKN